MHELPSSHVRAMSAHAQQGRAGRLSSQDRQKGFLDGSLAEVASSQTTGRFSVRVSSSQNEDSQY